jgi:hypothetical protein
VEAEVYRFLSSNNPEVLCLKGRWGVGKTYGWRSILAKAKQEQALKFNSYSYVSLFGLNSLDSLRYAIFENTVSGNNIGRDPDSATFSELIRDKDSSRKLGWFAEAAGALLNRKGVADLFARSAFLLVREQLVCLDDLERAGTGLGPREVLGLASQLKEERKCKVVLLINDEEHDDKREFDRQLEKVADLTLTFDPTSAEAIRIGLSRSGIATPFLEPLISSLNITNIRVIKKIERLSVRLLELLRDYDGTIQTDSIATLTLVGWSIHQPKLAPSIEFIRRYNRIAIQMRSGREQIDIETARYRDQIADYPFRGASVLDHVIIDGAQAGYFVEERIKQAANQVAREKQESSGDAGFYRVWEELYYGSLDVDDDMFLEEIFKVSMNEASVLNSLNINEVILFLREFGRDLQAKQLIERFVTANEHRGIEFFNISNHHFMTGDKIDKELEAAFVQKCMTFTDSTSLLEAVRNILFRGTWRYDELVFLSEQSTDQFVNLFESLKGDEIRLSVEMLKKLSISGEPLSAVIDRVSLEALRGISRKSKLRARKIRSLGINIDEHFSVKQQIAESRDHRLDGGIK